MSFDRSLALYVYLPILFNLVIFTNFIDWSILFPSSVRGTGPSWRGRRHVCYYGGDFSGSGYRHPVCGSSEGQN